MSPHDSELGSKPRLTVGETYDRLHLAGSESAVMKRVWRSACGSDYPDDFDHISFLTRPELECARTELRLAPGDAMGDLACGTGGPGLWIVRETGASLVGIDVSAVAIARAKDRATRLGLHDVVDYRMASFDATGLAAASLDAVFSIDAIVYASDPAALLREIARIVRSGARLFATTFEIDREAAARLGPVTAAAVEDYRPLLEAAGFSILRYEETPGWAERLAATYKALRDARSALRAEADETGIKILLAELSHAVEHGVCKRRVLIVAERD
jgi:ubiquinone/menaquinone biosynthesis C-methylase UbiE